MPWPSEMPSLATSAVGHHQHRADGLVPTGGHPRGTDGDTKRLDGSGGWIELAAYSTLVNSQRRVLSDIGLERRARDITKQRHQQAKQEAARKEDT